MPATHASRSSLIPDYSEKCGGTCSLSEAQEAELKRLFPDVDSPNHFLRGVAERAMNRRIAEWINSGQCGK